MLVYQRVLYIYILLLLLIIIIIIVIIIIVTIIIVIIIVIIVIIIIVIIIEMGILLWYTIIYYYDIPIISQSLSLISHYILLWLGYYWDGGKGGNTWKYWAKTKVSVSVRQGTRALKVTSARFRYSTAWATWGPSVRSSAKFCKFWLWISSKAETSETFGNKKMSERKAWEGETLEFKIDPDDGFDRSL